ncbi:hypothetical protein BG003_005502 [Podila horticola]|nr:hypothetical protein BG003_005502 [Podila horticola]
MSGQILSTPKSKIPPHHTLTSLSLTHVQFSDDDLVSKIFAHLTLSPLAITCGYIAVILTTRDLTPILMLAGQALNECVNFVLKRFVKQARPTEYLGDGYGMPSSHSQFMAFFATYLTILMYRRGVTPGSISDLITNEAFSRPRADPISVHLYYHTWQQVVAGTICGCLFATGYFFFVNNFLRSKGMQDWMVGNSFAHWALLRDVGEIDNVYKWEWDNWQQWRKANLGKTD